MSSGDERSLAASDNAVGTSCDDDRPESDNQAGNNSSADDGDESKTNCLIDGLRLREEQTVTTDALKSQLINENSDTDVHLNDESTVKQDNVENILKKSVHNLDTTDWSILYTEVKKFIVGKSEDID